MQFINFPVMKKAIATLFFAAIFITAAFAQPRPGVAAPKFTLPDASGGTVTLDSLKGKLVLLDFWASWCGPCRATNKTMQPLYKKYKQRGFEIVSISLDDNKYAWKNAIKQDNMVWLQVHDEQIGGGSALTRFYRVAYIPYTVLIDKEGTILAINPSKQELEKMIGALL